MPSHLEHVSNAELKCAIKFILQPYCFPFITLKCVCSNPKSKHSHCFFCFIIAIGMSHFTQIIFLSPFYFIGIHKLNQRKLNPELLKSSNRQSFFFLILVSVFLSKDTVTIKIQMGHPIPNSHFEGSTRELR